MILYIITCEKLRHSSGMTGLKPVKSGFLLTFIITDVDTVIIFREKKFGRTTYSVDMEFFFFFYNNYRTQRVQILRTLKVLD